MDFIELTKLIFIAATSLLISIAGERALLMIANVGGLRLKNIFFLPIDRSDKSSPIRLGGLPIFLSTTTTIIYTLFFSQITLSSNHRTLLLAAILSATIIALYGYLDDKLEIGPRIKISFQSLAMILFAFFASNTVAPEYPVIAFILIFLAGMGLINGTNLLDGVDTLSSKMAFATFSIFLALGIYFSNITVTIYSVIFLSATFGFYLFNRRPAKIYLGEIGSVLLGFSYLFLSTSLYTDSAIHFGAFSGLIFVLLPFAVFQMETVISIARRALTKNDILRGDQLHLHHILLSSYKRSVESCSNIISITHLLFTSISILLSFYNSCLTSFVTLIASFILFQLSFAFNDWKRSIQLHRSKYRKGSVIHTGIISFLTEGGKYQKYPQQSTVKLKGVSAIKKKQEQNDLDIAA